MKITITLSGLSNFTQLIIDDQKQEAKLNRTKINLNIDDFSSKILSIVSSWDKRMVNEFVLDGQEYMVRIEKNNKVYDYYGRNKYPDNYREFITLLKENNIV